MTITLTICTTLATAMGPQINRHLKTLGAGIFSTLADAKVSINNTVKPPLTATFPQQPPFYNGHLSHSATVTSLQWTPIYNDHLNNVHLLTNGHLFTTASSLQLLPPCNSQLSTTATSLRLLPFPSGHLPTNGHLNTNSHHLSTLCQ